MKAEFRLDSGVGFGDSGRYSFAGQHPFGIFRSWGDQVEFHTESGVRRWTGDPFDALKEVLKEYHRTPFCDTPLQQGGMVGYLGYGLRRWTEQTPDRAVDDLNLPDIWLGCFENVSCQEGNSPLSLSQELALSRMKSRSGRPLNSNFTRPAYLETVQRIKDYIVAGDVYQVNLAQRFTRPWLGSPASLYDRLCRHNRAPFSAYIDTGSFQIVSASPERFLQFDPVTRRVETRPIKGTRPRGETGREDARLAEALQSSEKDNAEHIMIVDLERNDLGRVCETGTVCVPELCRLEAHPTVWHLVSIVEGRLKPACDRIDLLRATFPGGSITGAPKIRAMEIIDELEPTARGIYTGAIGYLGFDGTMDLNIAIRTIVIQAGKAYVHVGGGIVADSDPSAEYEETLVKAKAQLWALETEVE